MGQGGIPWRLFFTLPDAKYIDRIANQEITLPSGEISAVGTMRPLQG